MVPRWRYVAITLSILLGATGGIAFREGARVRAAPPSPDGASSKAASLAVSAMSRLGLLETSPVFWYYDGVTKVGSGHWRASFHRTRCEGSSHAVPRCPILGTASFELATGEASQVRSIDGFPRKVELALREMISPPEPTTDPHWEFTPPTITGDGRLVSTFGIWVGRIPAPGYGSSCHFEIRSIDGSLAVWRSSRVDVGTPWTEEMRSDRVVGSAGVPAEYSDGRPEIVCTHWSGRGWQPDTGVRPRPEKVDAGRSDYVVNARLRWEGPPFGDAYSKCTTRVYGPDNAVIAEGSDFFKGPREVRDPLERSIALGANYREGGRERTPERASLECSFVSPQEYEQLGSD